MTAAAGDGLSIAMLTVAAREGENAITDYIERLCAALEAGGVDVHRVTGRDWGIRGFLDIRRQLGEVRPDVFHIQHPVSFARRSYVPQILSLARQSVVTTHGGSRYGWLGARVSLGPFMLRSRHIIFTTDEERKHALGWAPWIRSRSSVVPIGANIPAAPAARRDERLVVSFGLVRLDKGLEDVIELARLFAVREEGWRVRVVGQVPEGASEYAARLRADAVGLPVDWVVGLDHAAAAVAVGEAAFAYLPFPDGASERRGSLLACLGAGNAVITTRGPQTPPGLDEAVAYAATPLEALDALARLSADAAAAAVDGLRQHGMAFAAGFSWESIAEQHIRLYRSLVSR